jgi:pimeloyl-ACP methyl ester carboxylesterase
VKVVPPPRLEGTYQLDAKRRISFAEYGSPHGLPVFWFHGTPGGSRQIAPATRRAATELGIRLIALDRPGIGASTAHLHPDVGAFADDVLCIADRLGIEQFACIGLSGGGPYVLACAARAPDRVVACALLGSVAPSHGPEAVGGGLVGLIHRFAPAIEASRGIIARALHPFYRLLVPFRWQVFDAYIALQPEGDQRVFHRTEMRDMFVDDLMHAARAQIQAPLIDVLLFTRDWGFSLRTITVPVRIWHGDEDWIVPLAHAEHIAALLTDAELRVRPGESHLGALDASYEIFETIMALWPEPRVERAG